MTTATSNHHHSTNRPLPSHQFPIELSVDRKHVLWTCMAIILFVSIYDTFLTYKYRETILLLERNPICHYLITLEPAYLTFFLIGKIAGNVFVVGALLALFHFGYQKSLFVTICLAVFQVGLFGYLQFADPQNCIFDFRNLNSANINIASRARWSLYIHVLFGSAFAIFLMSARHRVKLQFEN